MEILDHLPVGGDFLGAVAGISGALLSDRVVLHPFVPPPRRGQVERVVTEKP